MPACTVDRLLKLILGCARNACCVIQQKKLALDANQLRDAPELLPALALLYRTFDRNSLVKLPSTSENLAELALEDHVRQRGSCFVKPLERVLQHR